MDSPRSPEKTVKSWSKRDRARVRSWRPLAAEVELQPVARILRTYRDGHRGWRPGEEGKKTVDVSSQIWQLLHEYDVPAAIKSVYNVHIQVAQTRSEQVQLTLCGRLEAQVARMLADPPRKSDMHERVNAWLLAEGPNGIRIRDIRKRSGALVSPSRGRTSVLLVGPTEATLASENIIDKCDCIEEFGIDNFVGFYLIYNDAYHQKRLGVETDALISAPPVVGATKWKAVVVGPTESVKRLRSKLDALYIKRHQVPQAVCSWLINPGNGVNSARTVELNRTFKTYIHPAPLTDDNDPTRTVDLVVVGEHEQNVHDVLAIIDGLHGKRRRIPQVVLVWLTNPEKGAACSRATDLDRKFDAHIAMGPSAAESVPASMADFAVIGECEENVDHVFAAIDCIVVEKVNFTKLQEEFWMGHEDEQNRNRPFHQLEDTTDTCIMRDDRASCLHVSGKPEGVRCVVNRVGKTQHIKLRTGPAEISLAAGHYISRIRHKFENDDVQIHLRYVGMRPGSCELRRLYRVDREEDEGKADAADQKVMQEIDLYEW